MAKEGSGRAKSKDPVTKKFSNVGNLRESGMLFKHVTLEGGAKKHMARYAEKDGTLTCSKCGLEV